MTRNHIIVVQDDDVESMLKGMRNSLPTPLTGMTMLMMMIIMIMMMLTMILAMMMRRIIVEMQASSCTNVQPAEFSLNDGFTAVQCAYHPPSH